MKLLEGKQTPTRIESYTTQVTDNIFMRIKFTLWKLLHLSIIWIDEQKNKGLDS